MGCELRAIIRSNMVRHISSHHQVRQDSENALAVQATGHVERQALTSKLINDREHTELAAILRAVLDEVIGPDVVARLRSYSNAGGR